jgi:hypothetical protein
MNIRGRSGNRVELGSHGPGVTRDQRITRAMRVCSDKGNWPVTRQYALDPSKRLLGFPEFYGLLAHYRAVDIEHRVERPAYASRH